MFVHYLILHKNGRVMLSSSQYSVSGSEKNRFRYVWSGSEPVVRLNHSRYSKWLPLPLHMHAAMFSTGFVDKTMRNTVPSINEPLLQLVNAMFRFCVMSRRYITWHLTLVVFLLYRRVETQLRWGAKLCMRLIAKIIRISHAKFHCNRLTIVQDIQDYASLFLGGGAHCIIYAHVPEQLSFLATRGCCCCCGWRVKTAVSSKSIYYKSVDMNTVVAGCV